MQDRPRRKTTSIPRLGLFITFVLCAFIQTAAWGQGSEITVKTEALSPIDEQFMAQQRAKVEVFANEIGRRLTGTVDRDLSTLQRIVDSRRITDDDRLTLQALGVVFGDLLARELDMRWVVYRDRAGRSRALQYRQDAIFLFPVTMIQRRYEAGSDRSLRALFDEQVEQIAPLLPGAAWLR